MKLCLCAVSSLELFFYADVFRLPWKLREPAAETAPHADASADIEDTRDEYGITFFHAKTQVSTLRPFAETAEVRFCNPNSQEMTIAAANLLEVKNPDNLAAQERRRWTTNKPTFGNLCIGDLIVRLPMDYVPGLATNRYPDKDSRAFRELCQQYLAGNDVVIFCFGNGKEPPSEVSALLPDVTWSRVHIHGPSYFQDRTRTVRVLKEMAILQSPGT